MSPRRCCIDNCLSISGKPQHRGVTFHTFPLNPEIRETWRSNCRIHNKKVITKSTLVCSRHFRRPDFQPLKNNKYFLKQGAVPTIFPWGHLPYKEPELKILKVLESLKVHGILPTSSEIASGSSSAPSAPSAPLPSPPQQQSTPPINNNKNKNVSSKSGTAGTCTSTTTSTTTAATAVSAATNITTGNVKTDSSSGPDDEVMITVSDIINDLFDVQNNRKQPESSINVSLKRSASADNNNSNSLLKSATAIVKKKINARKSLDLTKRNKNKNLDKLIPKINEPIIMETVEHENENENETTKESSSSSSSSSKVIEKKQQVEEIPNVVESIMRDIAKTFDPVILFVPGNRIEAQDFKKIWHQAKVMEVDHEDHEVLIHFEKSKTKQFGGDEWISMNSSRLRPPTMPTLVEPQQSQQQQQQQSSSTSSPMESNNQLHSQHLSKTTNGSSVKSPSNASSSGNGGKSTSKFKVGEKCLARWTDCRKFSATVQKVLDNDTYEVLFYDGYSKIVKGAHMAKIKMDVASTVKAILSTTAAATATTAVSITSPTSDNSMQTTPAKKRRKKAIPSVTSPIVDQHHITTASKPIATPTTATTATTTTMITSPPSPSSTVKSPSNPIQVKRIQRTHPIAPIPKFDLAKFNLAQIPRDGEWCCHWINDVPIGVEAYLDSTDGLKRPTVLVDDWRLPSGWLKHLYQRSSVTGKWDVVLVGPTKKRFRSKNDVKLYLEEHGENYNPDVYDFSIHKRRAKDLGFFILTDEYRLEMDEKLKKIQLEQLEKQRQQQQREVEAEIEEEEEESVKKQQHQEQSVTVPTSNDITLTSSDNLSTTISDLEKSNVIDNQLNDIKPSARGKRKKRKRPLTVSTRLQSAQTPPQSTPPSTTRESSSLINPLQHQQQQTEQQPTQHQQQLPLSPLEEGMVYVGSLKVRIIDNLFRCPDEQCNKKFRKENHLQIHVKHTHSVLAKQLGKYCPNMQDLAYLRTMGQPTDDSIPKNQIPNVQFFEKVYQTDVLLKSTRHKSPITSPIPPSSQILSSPKSPIVSIVGQQNNNNNENNSKPNIDGDADVVAIKSENLSFEEQKMEQSPSASASASTFIVNQQSIDMDTSTPKLLSPKIELQSPKIQKKRTPSKRHRQTPQSRKSVNHNPVLLNDDENKNENDKVNIVNTIVDDDDDDDDVVMTGIKTEFETNDVNFTNNGLIDGENDVVFDEDSTQQNPHMDLDRMLQPPTPEWITTNSNIKKYERAQQRRLQQFELQKIKKRYTSNKSTSASDNDNNNNSSSLNETLNRTTSPASIPTSVLAPPQRSPLPPPPSRSPLPINRKVGRKTTKAMHNNNSRIGGGPGRGRPPSKLSKSFHIHTQDDDSIPSMIKNSTSSTPTIVKYQRRAEAGTTNKSILSDTIQVTTTTISSPTYYDVDDRDDDDNDDDDVDDKMMMNIDRKPFDNSMVLNDTNTRIISTIDGVGGTMATMSTTPSTTGTIHSLSAPISRRTAKMKRTRFLKQNDKLSINRGGGGGGARAMAGIDDNRISQQSTHKIVPIQPIHVTHKTPGYINENGEMIKIVRMRQEEIINCLCTYTEEDGLMIQCELCLCWQHGSCNGIEKESQVPEKYICYICKNPERSRPSFKYKHDQDWLYEGKLPISNLDDPHESQRFYGHQKRRNTERFDTLKRAHTLTGNLLELKRFMHSLQVKMNIANNKDHPKMYLWSNNWETNDERSQSQSEEKQQQQQQQQQLMNDNKNETKINSQGGGGGNNATASYNMNRIPNNSKDFDQTILKENDTATTINTNPIYTNIINVDDGIESMTVSKKLEQSNRMEKDVNLDLINILQQHNMSIKINENLITDENIIGITTIAATAAVPTTSTSTTTAAATNFLTSTTPSITTDATIMADNCKALNDHKTNELLMNDIQLSTIDNPSPVPPLLEMIQSSSSSSIEGEGEGGKGLILEELKSTQTQSQAQIKMETMAQNPVVVVAAAASATTATTEKFEEEQTSDEFKQVVKRIVMETEEEKEQQLFLKQSSEKSEPSQKQQILPPYIPQPEAAIDPAMCQVRLLEHIKLQQQNVYKRLQMIEKGVMELEALDGSVPTTVINGNDEITSPEDTQTRETIYMLIQDLNKLRRLSVINETTTTTAALTTKRKLKTSHFRSQNKFNNKKTNTHNKI